MKKNIFKQYKHFSYVISPMKRPFYIKKNKTEYTCKYFDPLHNVSKPPDPVSMHLNTKQNRKQF